MLLVISSGRCCSTTTLSRFPSSGGKIVEGGLGTSGKTPETTFTLPYADMVTTSGFGKLLMTGCGLKKIDAKVTVSKNPFF